MRIAICAGTRQIGHALLPFITASEHVAHTQRCPQGVYAWLRAASKQTTHSTLSAALAAAAASSATAAAAAVATAQSGEEEDADEDEDEDNALAEADEDMYGDESARLSTREARSASQSAVARRAV